MAEYYLFFNSTINDRRRTKAEDMAKYWRAFLSTGIISRDNDVDLEVTASGTDRNVKIGIGNALIHGHLYGNDKEGGDLLKEIDGSHPTLNRIDRVVLRYDNKAGDDNSRFIKSFVIKGEVSNNPQPPKLTRTDDVYELSLARINVVAGKSFIEQSDVVDERLDESVCGLTSALNSVPTDVFLQEWNEWFNKQQTEGYVLQSEKGQPGGIASLGTDGRVPPEQLGNIYEVTDNLSYDQYLLWLELYYKGLISHVDVRGAKAIMMDGFVDTDNSEPPFFLDSIKKVVHARPTPASRYSHSMSGSTQINSNDGYFTAQSFRGVGTLTSIRVHVENNDTDGGGRYYVLLEGDPSEGTTTISDSKLLYAPNSNGSTWVRRTLTYELSNPITLDPTKTYVLQTGSTRGTGARAGWPHYWRHSNTQNTYGSAWIKNGYNSSWSQVSGRTYAMDLVGDGVGFLPLSNATYRTKTKSLVFTPVKAKLYLSVKEPTGTSIIPSITSNGSRYEVCEFISSRPDPKFPDYTEKEYEVTFENLGQVLGFRAALNASATMTPEIKRYGLILQ